MTKKSKKYANFDKISLPESKNAIYNALMKKFLYALSALIFFVFSPHQITFAENKTLYAKVEKTQVFFLSTPNENSPLFELPYSYFVKVKNSVDDFFECEYLGKSGYVKKSDVTLMSGTPQQPFAQASFKIFVSNYLFSNPYETSPVVTELSANETLVYYGRRSGQPLSSNTNVWYYSSITKNGQNFFGYVFEGLTDYLSPIETNTEKFPLYSEEISPPTEFAGLSKATKIMLIISISLPSALILYFLIKPGRITQTQKRRKRKTRSHHGDYFEFDESQL